MSYRESGCKCDWCLKSIGSGDDMACAKCVDELEGERDRLRETLREARDRIEQLESSLSSLEEGDR